jgi:hypothetical protein
VSGALVGGTWPLVPIILLFLIVFILYALFTLLAPAVALFVAFMLTSLPGLPLVLIVRSKFYSYYARKYGRKKIGWKEIPGFVKIILIIICFTILFSVGAIISAILGLTTYYYSSLQQMADSINSIINVANEAIRKIPAIIGTLSDFVHIVVREPFASIIMYIVTIWMYQSILPALIGGTIGSAIRGALKS